MTIYIGTLGNDLINGSLSEDFLLGLAGKDTIFGGKGNDVINGDEGNDPTKQNQQDSTIYEGKDDDFLSGDEGNDTLFGEQGNDVILGGEGEDVGFGGDSNDWVNGNENNDTLHGNRGKDTVIGGEGNDLLYGGQNNDFLLGDRGNDTLSGDKGDDIGLAGIGNDLVFGGEGNDFLNGNENDDTIEGGNGNDTLHGGKESDRLFGGEGDDILIGDLGADTVSGGAGNDIFVIGRRNDVSGFRTTGGVNIIDADYFLDFTPDEDVIELIGNLPFSELNIFAGTGIYANHTLIQDKGTTEYLAILKGVNPNSISAKDFIPITVTKEAFPGTLEFSAANFSVNEDGTPIASITINRTNGDSGIVSVKVLVNGGSAVGGSPPLAAPKDYDNSFITVTWADGDTTPKTVNIPIFNDTEVEGNETVNLTLSDPTNGAIIGLQNTAVLTIIDNDTFIPNPGVLSFTKANYSENEGNGGTVNKIVATIQRDSGSDGTVTVQAQLDTGSTATADDFTNNLPITVTFLPGETSRNIEIPIIGDGIPEGNDTINLKLVNPTGGASLGVQQTATYTIINDDVVVAPTFDFSSATYTVTEGNGGSFNTNAVVKINRTGDISGTNSIQIQLANGASPSATGGVDYNNTPITVTFNPGDTFKDVSVPIAGDTDVEQDENIALTLVNPSVGNVGTTTPNAVLTIINDDLANVSLTATDTKAAETGDTGTYRISRGTNTIGALTVNLNIDGSSLAKSTDYILSGGSVTIAGSNLTATIPDGQSFVDITLTPNDDIHAEADETLKLNLAAGSYNIDGVNKEGTVAIAANDTVVISLADDANFVPNYANREGTLRQAMLNAEAFAGTDTITFSGVATSGTINLTGDLPVITQNLNINGTGAANLNVRRDTGGEYRIFTVASGDVNFDGLTISNGLLSFAMANGGSGIANFSTGTINVNNTTFSNNNTQSGLFDGGAISNLKGGTVNVSNSTFSNNQSNSSGGAIANLNGGTVNVINSTFTNNFADLGGIGGGIFNAKGSTVNVSKSTFSGNQSKNNYGGAIDNEGTLTVTDSSFSDNKAPAFGGAISNVGSLVVTNSDFTNNKSGLNGGAISSSSTLNITKSTFSANKSTVGGALSIAGTANITDSNFSENAALVSIGGAVYIDTKDTVTIDRTTLANNSANQGGAIWNQSNGTVKVTNSTIANNTANNTGGGVVNNGNLDISNSTISGNKANRIGGGIYHDSTTNTFNINQSTITNNTADFDSNDTGSLGGDNGGGIFIRSGTVSVKNTIVAANIDNSTFGGINPDFSGNLTSKGYNLIGNVGTQNFSSNTTGDLYGDPKNTTTKNTGATEFASAIDPKLAPLANNGGLTQTHALQTGSPAIDAGDPAFVPPPNTDQRGASFDRIQGGRIDIGAFESKFTPTEIRGIKWNDLNGDRIRNIGEPGLAGWTIYLDLNNNSKPDSGEPSTTTDVNGNYAFTGLSAGTYTVAEVRQRGWRQTFPGTFVNGSGTGGNILVSTNQTIGEYTQAGTAVSAAINIPYGAGARPGTESARDIIIDQNNLVFNYNGTFDPFLSIYDRSNSSWNHRTHPGWSTVNNVSYGGIAKYQNFVYATDMITSGPGDTPTGIVRFDLSNNTSARFADTQQYIDLTMGLDGVLYALKDDSSSSGRTVDAYDPVTMNLLWTTTLANDARGIAVNENGDIFAAAWDGNIRHFDCDGNQLNFKASGTTNLSDIDVSFDGKIIVGSRFGQVIITDESLASQTSFSVGSDDIFVSFSTPQMPIAILNPTHTVTLNTGQVVTGIDFGAIAT
ncbi:beta strand repeat-containing protein [Aerosakkonemataceae cyanobacterium BLCC-F50]|uniref:Beta strand repeat-containing protein n=1 Tax=Floridaenema flaviceps BLCC-F50 TaxID=3153642 RepID=A0ABV4XWM7_9CYAN